MKWGFDMGVKRARKAIPNKTSRHLWLRAGGRCEYCNLLLYRDSLTTRIMNKAYISHIIAARENFVRGDNKLSKELEVEFENLMLLCDECHNRIDKSQPEDHTVEVLQRIKKNHEDRIERLTSLSPKNESQIVSFTARIGDHQPKVTFEDAASAILPEFNPNSHRMIELGIENYPKKDDSEDYWIELESVIEGNFNKKLMPLLEEEKINHYSIFGLAPQPLLIKVGSLISDLRRANVYTCLREPQTWKHPEDQEPIDFEVIEPVEIKGNPILNISITADISDERITSVLDEEHSIWKLTVPHPGKDLIRSDATLQNFRMKVRDLFENIKQAHGQEAILYVFPAMPNSTAIEFGRVWQPKAELPMIIYDQNSTRDGFIKTITISKKRQEVTV